MSSIRRHSRNVFESANIDPGSPTEDPITRACRGTNYTVQAGDSCKSIAADHSLAIDRFLEDNSIDFQCASLKEGAKVCIGKSCLLHEVCDIPLIHCSDLSGEAKRGTE